MHIDQLRYLIEIGNHKSMNIASQQLHISPQALSTSIKKLETELNTQLLVRSTVGVNLTKEAQQLVDLSQNFLNNLNMLFNLSEKTSDKSMFQSMNICVPHGFSETHMPSLLRSLFNSYPDIDINVHSETYLDIIANIQNDNYPFGITYQLFVNDVLLKNDIPDDLKFVPLFSEIIEAVIPNSIPLANASSISLNSFVKYPVIMYQPANYLMSQLFFVCAKPSKVINVPSQEASIALLDAGLGVGFSLQIYETGHSFLPYSNSTVHVPFKEKVVAQCGYVCKKNLSDPASLAQLNFIEKMYHSIK